VCRTVARVSNHANVRAAAAPDQTGQAPGAFWGYGRRVWVRVPDHRSESVGHIWPAA